MTGLSEGTSYLVTIDANDVAGNVTTRDEAAFTTASSDQPPTAPTEVAASPNPTQGSFSLTWAASIDDDATGVAAYELLRGGTVVATVPWHETDDSEYSLAEGANLYQVRALDTAGLVSPLSETVTVIVDQTPPVVDAPGNVVVEATSPAGAMVDWPAPTATDNRDGDVPVVCDDTPATWCFLFSPVSR